ncbi:MAG: glycosyltransferase family 4 protein, partial [Acidobacteriota bacterium]
MSEKASVPVVHMPLAVDIASSKDERHKGQDSEHYTRRDFGLADDQTVFLFTFDFSSRVRRKNPQGVIEAFRRAFPADRRDVALVLKSKTVDSVPEQVEDARTVAEIARRDRRVRLINETWPRRKVLDLIACCDVYVSLHRAEGFGLGMAEAMQFGKPVIATDYSGNTDFTHPDNACLVGFELIDVEPGENYDLEGSSVWAEPDIDEAADHMRFLARDREARRRLGDRGRRYIEELHSPRTIGERYRQRLERIGLL